MTQAVRRQSHKSSPRKALGAGSIWTAINRWERRISLGKYDAAHRHAVTTSNIGGQEVAAIHVGVGGSRRASLVEQILLKYANSVLV